MPQFGLCSCCNGILWHYYDRKPFCLSIYVYFITFLLEVFLMFILFWVKCFLNHPVWWSEYYVVLERQHWGTFKRWQLTTDHQVRKFQVTKWEEKNWDNIWVVAEEVHFSLTLNAVPEFIHNPNDLMHNWHTNMEELIFIYFEQGLIVLALRVIWI